MDSQKTNELYEKFPHLYRERTAPLESSSMGWGFQCENGWYKIIYEMSKKIDKISNRGRTRASNFAGFPTRRRDAICCSQQYYAPRRRYCDECLTSSHD